MLLDLQFLIELIKLLLFLQHFLLLLLFLKVLFLVSLVLGIFGVEIQLPIMIIARMLLLQLFALEIVVIYGSTRRFTRFPLARKRSLETLFSDVEMFLVVIDVHTKKAGILPDLLLCGIIIIIKLLFHELVTLKPRNTTRDTNRVGYAFRGVGERLEMHSLNLCNLLLVQVLLIEETWRVVAFSRLVHVFIVILIVIDLIHLHSVIQVHHLSLLVHAIACRCANI